MSRSQLVRETCLRGLGLLSRNLADQDDRIQRLTPAVIERKHDYPDSALPMVHGSRYTMRLDTGILVCLLLCSKSYQPADACLELACFCRASLSQFIRWAYVNGHGRDSEPGTYCVLYMVLLLY